MAKKYTSEELENLVSELTTQFGTHLAKSEEQATLVKAEDDKKDAKDEKKDDDKDDKKSDKKDDKSDDKKDDKKDEKELPAFMKSEYNESDIKELGSLYSGMTKAERAAHMEALTKAESQPETLAKSEKSSTHDEEIAALKKSNDELQKGMAELVLAMNKKLVKPSAPKMKSVTGLTELKKSEEPAKASITREDAKKILGKKAQTPDLAKNERDLINDFCMNKVGLEKIQHLLN